MVQYYPELAQVEPETYPLGEKSDPSTYSLALVALSHTSLEHKLYSAMLSGSFEPLFSNSFTARQLGELTGIRSLTTIRRGLEGLLAKLSIERQAPANGNGKKDQAARYRVYPPSEILTRRKQNGSHGPFDRSENRRGTNASFERAISRVADNPSLSRREAQVVICCVEGLSNAEIGKRLNVTEQTVKFHLRHVFIKLGVKRRTELISKLLL